jgi:hypothetical protein
LQENGAEFAETGFVDGVLYAWISGDYRRHLFAFGIDLPPQLKR